MSANTVVYVKKLKKGFRVYFQTCADNSDLGTLEGKYKTLKGVVDKAKKISEEYEIEYGINFV